jgi:hypothetical protein
MRKVVIVFDANTNELTFTDGEYSLSVSGFLSGTNNTFVHVASDDTHKKLASFLIDSIIK